MSVNGGYIFPNIHGTFFTSAAILKYKLHQDLLTLWCCPLEIEMNPLCLLID